jgi:hypothetical protein
MNKGVLVAKWGQFQFLDLNHKPPKNNFLFFNKKNLILNLRNKITQQNASIVNKTNFFSNIAMKFKKKKISQLPSNDGRCGYKEI